MNHTGSHTGFLKSCLKTTELLKSGDTVHSSAHLSNPKTQLFTCFLYLFTAILMAIFVGKDKVFYLPCFNFPLFQKYPSPLCFLIGSLLFLHRCTTHTITQNVIIVHVSQGEECENEVSIYHALSDHQSTNGKQIKRDKGISQFQFLFVCFLFFELLVWSYTFTDIDTKIFKGLHTKI